MDRTQKQQNIGQCAREEDINKREIKILLGTQNRTLIANIVEGKFLGKRDREISKMTILQQLQDPVNFGSSTGK